METDKTIYDYANKYLSFGYSVVPIAQGKKFPEGYLWTKYQTEKADQEQIDKWFKETNNNIGIVTGNISGLVVVDVEKGGDTTKLPPTMMSKTGGGGWHFYYKHPGFEIKNAVRLYDLIDIRADGGLVVAPPSKHPSGNFYEWIIEPDGEGLADLPDWILEKIATKNDGKYNKINWEEFLSKNVPNGARNQTATQLIGKLFFHLPPEMWEISGWPTMLMWNKTHNTPPLELNELRTIWDSIKKKEAGNRQKIAEAIKDDLNITSIKDIIANDYGECGFIVDKLIPKEGITIISGRPKSGKSWFVLKILADMASKECLFGEEKFKINKTNILLIDEENSQRGLQRRSKKVIDGDLNFPVMSMQGFKIDDDVKRGKLKDYIEKNSIGLIILDSFRRVHSKDENKSEDIAKIYDCLKDIIINTKCAVVIIHHNRKIMQGQKVDMESLRGSGDIGAMVDSFILIESNPLKDLQGNSSTITTVLREDVAVKPFKVDWYDNENGDKVIFQYKGEVEEDEKKVNFAMDYIYDLVKNGGNSEITFKYIKTLMSKEDIGDKNIRMALKLLEAQNKIDFFEGGKTGREKFYIMVNRVVEDKKELSDDNVLF